MSSKKEKPTTEGVIPLEEEVYALKKEIDGLKVAVGNIPELLQATFLKYDEQVNNKMKMLSDSIPRTGSGSGTGLLEQIFGAVNKLSGQPTQSAEINDLANKIVTFSLRKTLKDIQKGMGITEHIIVEGK